MPDRPAYGDPEGDRELEQRREQRRIADAINRTEISAGSIGREAEGYWAAVRAEQDPGRRAGLEAQARDADERLDEAHHHLGQLVRAEQRGGMTTQAPPAQEAQAPAPGRGADPSSETAIVADRAEREARGFALAAEQEADPGERAALQARAEKVWRQVDEAHRQLGRERMAQQYGQRIQDRAQDPLSDREARALNRIEAARARDREADRGAAREP